MRDAGTRGLGRIDRAGQQCYFDVSRANRVALHPPRHHTLAGQPFWRAFLRRVEDKGGEEVILERIANGETLRVIAESYQVGRTTLVKFLKAEPDRYKRYQEMRIESAGALVDQAIEISDDADTENSASVQAAKNRADLRLRLAGMIDRATYGDDKKSAMQINIGELYLGVLKSHASPQAIAPAVSEAIIDGIEEEGRALDSGRDVETSSPIPEAAVLEAPSQSREAIGAGG